MTNAQSWGKLGKKYDFDELPYGKFSEIAKRHYPDWGEPLPSDDEGVQLKKYRVYFSYVIIKEDDGVFEAASPEQAKELAKEELSGHEDFQIERVESL